MIKHRWWAVSIALLAAAWTAAPAAVPIYDGISSPDEPYRYVAPPAGAPRTPPPSRAIAHVPVSRGRNATAYANSAESGPQISIYLPAGALAVRRGTSGVTVTATPVAPSQPLPRDGIVWGNVYRVDAVAGASALRVVGRGAQAPTIQMRAPSAQQPGPVFEHRASGGWVTVRTLRVGNDIYQASVSDFGDWALVRLRQAAGEHGSGGGGGVNGGTLGVGIALLAVAGVILTVRMSRARGAAR